jgi:hypothetical protein
MHLLDANAIALLHTLLTTNSLSRLSTLCAALQAPVEHILSIIANHPFVFARLRAMDSPGDDRIAVVLDLTNCTFYARPPNGCTKDAACPYLHLCPAVVLPNRRCQRPQDCPLSHSLDTEHNRRVIFQRGLENLPQRTLIMLILASADPSKTVSNENVTCRQRHCSFHVVSLPCVIISRNHAVKSIVMIYICAISTCVRLTYANTVTAKRVTR